MDMTDSPSKSPKSPDYDRSPAPAYKVDSFSSTSGAVGTSTSAAAASSSAAAGSGGSLFVGKLAFDCRTRELEELFGKYGRITRCDIKRGKEKEERQREEISTFFTLLGYAFVEFEDERDASDAIKYLDGTRFLGLNITVERTKGEKRNATNPDGSRSRECFKCGRVGHYAKECRSGGGRDRYERRDRVDRYERRGDRYDRDSRRDYDRRDRSDRYERDSRRSRSRSPQRNRSASRSPARY